MKTILVLAALALAGCGMKTVDELDAATVRRICVANGKTLGSPEFDRCFASTFATLRHGAVVAVN
jgi:hypothetical protein